MRRVLLTAALCVAAISAGAAPKAEDPAECEWFWDLAITARGMAIAGVDRELSRRAVWLIFKTEVPRMKEIANLIIDAAHAAPVKDSLESGGVFAAALQSACNEQSGNMDSILGTSSRLERDDDTARRQIRRLVDEVRF